MVVDTKFKQTHCVSYFTNIYCVFLYDLTSEKTDTTCELIYCVDLGFIWLLNSDLSIYTVLDILLRFVQAGSELDNKKKQTLCVANLLCWFWVELLNEQWFKQTHCVSYFNKIHSICFMIWTVNKSGTMC